MATFHQVLKSLLYIALFVLILLIATICLFLFVWSKSEKCSSSCQRIKDSKVTLESVEDHPDETWSEIPDELYPFFTQPPRFKDRIIPTTPDPCLEVPTDVPVAFVYYVAFNHSFPPGSREFFRINYRQMGIAAVLVNKWILMQDALLMNLIREVTSRPTLYARVTSKYARKRGEVVHVASVVHFKNLSALYLEHSIYSGCIQFASLLTHNMEVDNFTIFVGEPLVWDYTTKLAKQSVTLKASAEKDVCTPLFIESKNTYFFCGFTKCAANPAVYIFQDKEESYLKWMESLK